MDLWLSLEAFHDAFPPGFPTRLSHSDVPRATVVSVDPRFESRGSAEETGFSGCWRDSRASSPVETGMSGNFLSCSKGVKDPLKVPEFRCD